MLLNYLYNPLVSSPLRSRVYTLWQMGGCAGLCCTETRKRGTRRRTLVRASFVRLKGLAAASSSFPFLRSLPFGGAGIYIYTRQQGRGPKVKDQSFLLFIRGVGPGLRNTATIHFSFRLSLPLSFPRAFVVIVFSFPSLFLFLPFLTVPAIPNPFPCSMYYLWPYHLSLPLRFSIGFCLKELVLAHFARNPFFL